MPDELNKIDLALGIALGSGCGLLIAAVVIAGTVYFFPDQFRGIARDLAPLLGTVAANLGQS